MKDRETGAGGANYVGWLDVVPLKLLAANERCGPEVVALAETFVDLPRKLKGMRPISNGPRVAIRHDTCH